MRATDLVRMQPITLTSRDPPRYQISCLDPKTKRKPVHVRIPVGLLQSFSSHQILNLHNFANQQTWSSIKTQLETSGHHLYDHESLRRARALEIRQCLTETSFKKFLGISQAHVSYLRGLPCEDNDNRHFLWCQLLSPELLPPMGQQE